METMEDKRTSMERRRMHTESLSDVSCKMRSRKMRRHVTARQTNTICVESVRIVERAIQLITTMERHTNAQLVISGSRWRLDQRQRNQMTIWRMTQTVRMILNTTESIMVWVMVWGGKADRPYIRVPRRVRPSVSTHSLKSDSCMSVVWGCACVEYIVGVGKMC